MKIFELRGELSRPLSLILATSGIALVILIWFILTSGETPIVPAGILPHPFRVLTAVGDLYRDNNIIRNTCLSLGLNLAGYVEAIAISIPVGFAIGLYPLFKGTFQRQVDAIRYVPLTAVTGLFIVWFGVGTEMKVHFLAFGILIYLLPVIVQRIYEVNDVYLKTVYTLGATDWQTIKTVYFPSVISRLSDDIRVLTAISWTYIIVAEGIGSQGGIGALIWRAGLRQGRVDKVFAMLIIIIIIGIFQDKIFIYLDKQFFPHKYQQKGSVRSGKIKSQTVVHLIWRYMINAAKWISMVLYVLLFLNELTGLVSDLRPISYLFGDTAWVIHLVMWLIILYQGRSVWRKWSDHRAVQTVPSHG